MIEREEVLRIAALARLDLTPDIDAEPRYIGRIGLYEPLQMSEEIERLTVERASAPVCAFQNLISPRKPIGRGR